MMVRTVLLVLLFAIPCVAEHPIRFDIRVLTVDAHEGCDVGDIDDDGYLDVVAGRNWYRNGDWLPRPVRLIEDVNGYSASNSDFLYDVNRDGQLDIITGNFFQPAVSWYENPGREALLAGFLWKQHLLADTGQGSNEASFLHDLDGDNRPEWITNQWVATQPLLVWRWHSEPQAEGGEESPPRLISKVIGKQNGHGIGFGDLNNDGREDILVGTGWYERPAGDPWEGEWTYHADWNRQLSCPVLVHDVDRDGQNDIVWGNPHDFGLFWWQSQGIDADGNFSYREHVIDKSFSQPHCLHWADLDGDGTDELVTGKRVRAHNGNDPGGKEKPIICYYTWDAASHAFTRHIIHEGKLGIGLQIRSADIDGDGDIDLVMAGKDGTKILFNRSAD